MLYREIMAVCSEIHKKHINTVYGQNVELLNVKLVVHIVTTGVSRVVSVIKTSQLMLYREILVVCSQTHELLPHNDSAEELRIVGTVQVTTGQYHLSLPVGSFAYKQQLPSDPQTSVFE